MIGRAIFVVVFFFFYTLFREKVQLNDPLKQEELK